MDLFYAQHFRGVFVKVHYVNIHCQNKSVAQNIGIKCQDEKKYGQKIFVNSIVIYCANMALLSIAYGYKIHILLFEKHRNTKEVFQRCMRKAMENNMVAAK